MTHSSRKYPWEEWADGQVKDITKGVEYTCSTAQMRNYMYQKAATLGCKVRVNLIRDDKGEGLEFQFLGVPNKTQQDTPVYRTLDDLDDDDPRKHLDLSILTRHVDE